MFICETCAHPDLRWLFVAMLSKGPCENCGYTDACKDIHHSGVIINPNWRTDLQSQLDRAGITASSSRYKNPREAKA